MFDFPELERRLLECANGKVPLHDFQDWFDESSWNVHRQGNQDLTDTVFQIEAIFSAQIDGRLDVSGILGEFRKIASSIRQLPADDAASTGVREIQIGSAQPRLRKLAGLAGQFRSHLIERAAQA